MTKTKSYDAIIVGAGMSGMAAAIRLSMFNKKVCLLEKHVIPGGLNSYYRRGKRLFDVGLHALTNFCGQSREEKSLPLNRLLRQLRLNREDLQLHQQRQSKILFPEAQLIFSNDFAVLLSSIEQNFPQQIDAFQKLVAEIKSYNELDLTPRPYDSAKARVARFITDPYLLEMIFCPLLIYGSSWEQDMDYGQFVVMFKSIYLQGFARPEGGVRRIIELLSKRLAEEGAEVRYEAEVLKIVTDEAGKVQGVELQTGEFLATDCLISSMGYPETMELCSPSEAAANANTTAISNAKPPVGPLSFVESILVTEKPTSTTLANDDTIIFYNNQKQYDYRKPQTLIDDQSAVVCCPDNFSPPSLDGEGMVRVTMLANYAEWMKVYNEQGLRAYKEEKEKVYQTSLAIAQKCWPQFLENNIVVFKDVFTPRTILRYTGHLGGAVYGSTEKTRTGKTPYAGVYICGTDQGFLGIVGALLSGITIGNLYGLMSGESENKNHSESASASTTLATTQTREERII